MFQPFSTTGIGSLPLRDPEEACKLVFRTFDIPFWPQLPRLSFLELMVPQYAEGMPFIHIDEGKETIYLSRSHGDDLERFYETCKDGCRIAISDDYAKGLHVFLKAIKGKTFETLKGHVTGPLTFTLGLKDREGKLLYFDEELRQVALMLLQAKTRWQVDQLKACAENVLIFVDEPILTALGSSAYLGVSREETLRLLTEIVNTIVEAGGIPGIHCCANADWPVVIESGVRVLSFDAYGYFENLAMYHGELGRFLDSGGYLAWGMVPTTDAIREETPETIIEKFNNRIDALSGHIPYETLASRSILTPSCGTGSRSVEEAIKVFQLLIRLKEAFA